MAHKLLSPVLYPQNRNQSYFMEDLDEKPEEDKSSLASFCIAAIPFLALTIDRLSLIGSSPGFSAYRFCWLI